MIQSKNNYKKSSLVLLNEVKTFVKKYLLKWCLIMLSDIAYEWQKSVDFKSSYDN